MIDETKKVEESASLKYFAATLYIAGGIILFLLGGYYLWLVTVPISITLVLSGFLSLSEYSVGRRISLFALFGTAILVTVFVVELVPMQGGNNWVWYYLAVALFYVAVLFNLYLPRKGKCSHLILLFVAGLPAANAGSTYYDRWRNGEYNWPTIVNIRWDPGHEELHTPRGTSQWIDENTRQMLLAHGLKGNLRWMGNGGEPGNPNRVTIIMRAPIMTEKAIKFPKEGHIYYIYDGKKWSSLPVGTPVYKNVRLSLFPKGNVVGARIKMANGATAGADIFHWPK